MTLIVASMNVRRLRDPSKCARTSVCECCCSARDSLHLCRGLSGAGGRLCGLFSIRQPLQRWVSVLVAHSLNAIVDLVFADDKGRLAVADVAVKSIEFWVVAVYAPNSVGERRSFSDGWRRSSTIRNG